MLLLSVRPLIGCLTLVEVMNRMAAEFGLPERGQRSLHEVHRAHERELICRLELLVIEVGEGVARRTTGVDDQRVEPPEFADGALDGVSSLIGDGNVRPSGNHADSVRTDRLGRGLQRRFGACAHAHVGALCGELFGDGPSHALARRGDECSASAKPQIHGWDPSKVGSVSSDDRPMSAGWTRRVPRHAHTRS